MARGPVIKSEEAAVRYWNVARRADGDLSHILRASAAVNVPVQQEDCGNEDAHNSRREDDDDWPDTSQMPDQCKTLGY